MIRGGRVFREARARVLTMRSVQNLLEGQTTRLWQSSSRTPPTSPSTVQKERDLPVECDISFGTYREPRENNYD